MFFTPTYIALLLTLPAQTQEEKAVHPLDSQRFPPFQTILGQLDLLGNYRQYLLNNFPLGPDAQDGLYPPQYGGLYYDDPVLGTKLRLPSQRTLWYRTELARLNHLEEILSTTYRMILWRDQWLYGIDHQRRTDTDNKGTQTTTTHWTEQPCRPGVVGHDPLIGELGRLRQLLTNEEWFSGTPPPVFPSLHNQEPPPKVCQTFF